MTGDWKNLTSWHLSVNLILALSNVNYQPKLISYTHSCFRHMLTIFLAVFDHFKILDITLISKIAYFNDPLRCKVEPLLQFLKELAKNLQTQRSGLFPRHLL